MKIKEMRMSFWGVLLEHLKLFLYIFFHICEFELKVPSRNV